MNAGPESWWQFEQRLGQFLSALVDGEILIIETPDTSRYVQFLSWGDTAVHGEVSHEDAEFDLDRTIAMGWQPPPRDRKGRPITGSENVQMDVPPSDAHRLAAMTVAVLRDVWRVPEPQLLHASKVNDAGGPPPDQLIQPR